MATRHAHPAAAPPGDLDWRRYLHAVMRYRWWVLLGTALGGAAGVVFASRKPERYVARATIWVEVASPRDREASAAWPQLLGPSGWLDLLESRAVLDDVVHQERLYLKTVSGAPRETFEAFQVKPSYRPGVYRLTVDRPARSFTLSTREGDVLDQGGLSDSIGANVGFAWAPAAERLPAVGSIEFRLTSHHEAAQQLARDLRVATEPGANFIHVELKGGSPVALARILNTVAERFVVVATDLKRQKLTELSRIFGEQLQHARQNLQRAEAALRSFRVQSAPLLAEGTAPGAPRRPGADPAWAEYIDLRSEQAQLRRDRLAVERILAADTGLSVDALGLIGAVQRAAELNLALRELTTRQAELRALRFRYTADNPEIRRLASQLTTLQRVTLPGLARALTDELSTRERELSQRIDSASSELRRIPAAAIEDASLRRDVETAEEVFRRVQQRASDAQLAEVSSLPDVRILDASVPPGAPLGSGRGLLIAFAFAGSLAVGMLSAVALEHFDRTVQDPGEVTGDFGLRILGALPHVRSSGDGASQAIDALRGIRLNVLHAYGAGPVVLTVSSPSTSDGKTFVTSNLALAFADAGLRTLLVDADLRRGSLHRVLRARRKPGITDVLAGTIRADLAIQGTTHPGLSFLGCGSRTRTGPELLSSPAMTQLLVDLRASYGAILVDTPPLAAGVEPYALGILTGNLLLVLRLGMTDRNLAEAKLDALDRLPIRLLGAVLNDVRSPEAYGRYAYALEGYELRDEEHTWADGKILRQAD